MKLLSNGILKPNENKTLELYIYFVLQKIIVVYYDAIL